MIQTEPTTAHWREIFKDPSIISFREGYARWSEKGFEMFHAGGDCAGPSPLDVNYCKNQRKFYKGEHGEKIDFAHTLPF